MKHNTDTPMNSASAHSFFEMRNKVDERLAKGKRHHSGFGKKPKPAPSRLRRGSRECGMVVFKRVLAQQE
jgi:hypothetical protein